MALLPTPPWKFLPSTPSGLTRNWRVRKAAECSSVMERGPRGIRSRAACPPHYGAPHPHKSRAAPRVHRIALRRAGRLFGQTFLALCATTLATSKEGPLLRAMCLAGAADRRREAPTGRLLRRHPNTIWYRNFALARLHLH